MVVLIDGDLNLMPPRQIQFFIVFNTFNISEIITIAIFPFQLQCFLFELHYHKMLNHKWIDFKI